jgi:hypothetical protein
LPDCAEIFVVKSIKTIRLEKVLTQVFMVRLARKRKKIMARLCRAKPHSMRVDYNLKSTPKRK